MESYGGNVIKKMGAATNSTVFSDNTYYYALHIVEPRDSAKIDFLGEYTIFMKGKPGTGLVNVEVGGATHALTALDSIDIRGHEAIVRNMGEEAAHILVAGHRQDAVDKLIHPVKQEDAKRVFKPWGHELWITRANKNYSLKEVFLKEGRKTSLQYHEMRQETNVLVDGKAALWFKQNDAVENDSVVHDDLGQVPLEPLSSIDVLPRTIHRLEALTDITLYEASTPHLDDVIRLHDDNHRRKGTHESANELQICILTAGKGDRMGGLCDILNKALLPLRGKAVISHIVEKFPKSSRFVVALGYKGDQVRNYLHAAYPGYDFEFVQIDNYDRVGAGPGYSLKKCMTALGGKPFYFVACDTIIEDVVPFDLNSNWMGVCKVNVAISGAYCNFTVEGQNIVNMVDKEPYQDNHSKSFIGLSYIHDTEEFWKGLGEAHIRKGEWQMTNGIGYLLAQKPVKAVDFKWRDVGSYQQYLDLANEGDKFDFSKSNEFLYIVNNRVVKFFHDASAASNRASRTQFNPSVFPHVDFARGQFLAYPLVPGETLYADNDLKVFGELLEFLDTKVWKKRPGGVDITGACRMFYKDKTFARIEQLFEKYPRLRTNKKPINCKEVPALEELLAKVDWEALASQNIPSFIHGDLQFDNIIHSQAGFTLIDWRQEFAGLLEVGDLYYDLAKLYGGLVINYDLIKENHFSYKEAENGISFDFFSRNIMGDYRNVLEKFIADRGYSLKKVKLLVAIIYLNMSPLHHYPFDKMLFAIGTKRLHEELGG